LTVDKRHSLCKKGGLILPRESANLCTHELQFGRDFSVILRASAQRANACVHALLYFTRALALSALLLIAINPSLGQSVSAHEVIDQQGEPLITSPQDASEPLAHEVIDQQGEFPAPDTLALSVDSLSTDSLAADTLKPVRRTPGLAIKNNLLYDAALTPNLSLEFRLAKHWTMQLEAGFNPFPLDDKVEHKWRHLLVGLEAKYWFCEAFARDFVGVNAYYSHFNVAKGKYPIGWLYPSVLQYRFQGDMVAAGASYGWHFVLSKHVGLELEAGVDVGYAWFNRYGCAHCDALIDSPRKWFVMPKAGVNLAIVIPGDEDRDDDCPCRKKKAPEELEDREPLDDMETPQPEELQQDLAQVTPSESSDQSESSKQSDQSETAAPSDQPEQPAPSDRSEQALAQVTPSEASEQPAHEVVDQQGEPLITPAPVVPVLASPFASRILRPFTEYQPYTTDYVLSRDSDALYVYFELDSFCLKREFGRNAEVLDSIVMLVEALMADTMEDLKLIQLVGFASFDGPTKRNDMLAGNRALALKDYIQANVSVPDSLFEVNNGGEAWSEFAWAIEQSDFRHKEQVLRIIREEKDPAKRERRIKEHNKGWTYVLLRDQLLQKHRNAGYIRVYYDPKLIPATSTTSQEETPPLM